MLMAVLVKIHIVILLCLISAILIAFARAIDSKPIKRPCIGVVVIAGVGLITEIMMSVVAAI